MTAHGRRVVALGGGHGLAASLSALRRVTRELTAVVTVADDGGSSGRLRSELGALPPGDLRMALAALAGEGEREQMWSRVLQHRFGGDGPLGGHAVGNLLLAALCDMQGDPVAALEHVGELVGAVGRVLPLATSPLVIEAEVANLDAERPEAVHIVSGQHQVAVTRGDVLGVALVPRAPVACEEAVRAVESAECLVLGPGSLFTSVIPHLLVPQMHEAIVTSHAQRVYVLNLAAQPGETSGFSPQAHLEVLAKHAPELRLDEVVADPSRVPDRQGLETAAASMGATVHFAPVAVVGDSHRHDPQRLADAFRTILDPR